MALCLSLLIGVGACSEEEIAYSAGEENKEVILQLNCQLQTNQEVIVSRASTAENRLNDLHFYVFNAAGELTGYKKAGGYRVESYTDFRTGNRYCKGNNR